VTFSQFRNELSALWTMPIFPLGDGFITVGELLTALLFVLIAMILARFAARAVERLLLRRESVDTDTAVVMARVTRWLIVLPAIAIAMQQLGFNLTAVFTAGGLVALAAGFALKNVAENFISGIILQSERSIRRGDVLETEGQLVKVRDIGIRATIARGRDGEDLVIPNSQLVQAPVKNFTLNKDLLRRIRTTVGVVYSSDMRLVEETLLRVAEEQTWRSRIEEPLVFMAEFGSSSVDFDVSVWVDDPWRARRLTGELNRAIWWALKEAGVTIAFPQLDLHLDPEVAEALRRG
jgi:small-conductance mechanosensitive channel